MSSGLEIQLVAILISVACSVLGTFLVLRKISMVTDSITHTILLGIVLAFFITQDINSPLLIIGATIMGVITVWLIEVLTTTKLLAVDAAIGIVYPLLFSIAIILITRFAGSTHICVDSVMLGELAFAPFDRLQIFGIDIGAKAIYTGAFLLIVNTAFIIILFKELKIATFDPLLASAVGIAPVIIHYSFMTMVSLTTVISFEAVGSILVIAFMIGPPITASLLTNNLKWLFILSGIFGGISAILGYQVAYFLDVSIAGSIACTIGMLFVVVLILAPEKGVVSAIVQKSRQKLIFTQLILCFHIYKYQNTSETNSRNNINTIKGYFPWKQKKIDRLIKSLKKKNIIELKKEQLWLTTYGIESMKDIAADLLDFK